MKTINLLKEGHGLRYAPSESSGAGADEAEADRRPSRPRGAGYGKVVGVMVAVALLLGGLLWAYTTFKPWGPRLAAIRASVAPSSQPAKAPAPPQAAPEPTAAAAQAPPPAASPPPPPEATASKLERWFHADKAYPYTIVVASFQKEASAAAYARSLRAGGRPATVAPTDLGPKGRWFRVVLDRYIAVGDARQAAAILKEQKPFSGAWIAPLPFAVEVGKESSQASAEASRERLASKGVFALLFPEAAGADQPVTFRLIAGAFPSKEQAEAFATSLKASQVPAQVVRP